MITTLGANMQEWTKCITGIASTIESVMRLMDACALRIVLVCDDKNKLLGTVTDGDIRRALLQHKPLTIPISEIMCTTPIVTGEGSSREQMLGIMEAEQILHLPVLNEQSEVVGLQTVQGLLHTTSLPNPVFIMAGGFGTRLQPLTNNCPKPMLMVGNKPILEHTINFLKENGLIDFYISLHYLPEIIKTYFGDGSKMGVNIRYVLEESPLGTAGALGLLPKEGINNPLLMLNGDLLTSLDFRSLLTHHSGNSNDITVCAREYVHSVPYGVLDVSDQKLNHITEKPNHRWFVNAGIYVISHQIVKAIPMGGYLDMPSMINAKIAKGAKVEVFPIHEYWLDIGRKEDFSQAQSDIFGIRGV